MERRFRLDAQRFDDAGPERTRGHHAHLSIGPNYSPTQADAHAPLSALVAEWLRPATASGEGQRVVVDVSGVDLGETRVGVDADAYAAWVLTEAPPAAPRRRFHHRRTNHTDGITASA